MISKLQTLLRNYSEPKLHVTAASSTAISHPTAEILNRLVGTNPSKITLIGITCR